MNPIITGMVITVYGHYGFISPDAQYRDIVGRDVRYQRSKIIDHGDFVYGDRVEFEARKSPAGWYTEWVKWTGHGELEPVLDNDAVLGRGRITCLVGDGDKGFITPNIEGAADVKFWASNIMYKDFKVGDSVSFVARQGQNGLWRAKTVRKTDKPVPMPEPKPTPERNWRDSWKEDVRC